MFQKRTRTWSCICCAFAVPSCSSLDADPYGRSCVGELPRARIGDGKDEYGHERAMRSRGGLACTAMAVATARRQSVHVNGMNESLYGQAISVGRSLEKRPWAMGCAHGLCGCIVELCPGYGRSQVGRRLWNVDVDWVRLVWTRHMLGMHSWRGGEARGWLGCID